MVSHLNAWPWQKQMALHCFVWNATFPNVPRIQTHGIPGLHFGAPNGPRHPPVARQSVEPTLSARNPTFGKPGPATTCVGPTAYVRWRRPLANYRG